jgi:hypothetical protein
VHVGRVGFRGSPLLVEETHAGYKLTKLATNYLQNYDTPIRACAI